MKMYMTHTIYNVYMSYTDTRESGDIVLNSYSCTKYFML